MLGSPPLALLAFVAGLSLLLGSAVWVLAVRLRRAERERRRASSELSRRLSELFALQELSYVLAESLESGASWSR